MIRPPLPETWLAAAYVPAPLRSHTSAGGDPRASVVGQQRSMPYTSFAPLSLGICDSGAVVDPIEGRGDLPLRACLESPYEDLTSAVHGSVWSIEEAVDAALVRSGVRERTFSNHF